MHTKYIPVRLPRRGLRSLALFFLAFLAFVQPVTAQMIFNGSNRPNRNDPPAQLIRRNNGQVEAFITQPGGRRPQSVPGLYYDPNARMPRSRSFSQVVGSPQAGQISIPRELLNQYPNVARAWRAGANPAEMMRMSDALSNPVLQNWGSLTIDQIGQLQGIKILDQKISDVPLINNMSLGEAVRINGGRLPAPVMDALAAFAANPTNPVGVAISVGQQQALKQLANIHPELANLPIGQILNGDFKGALNAGKDLGARLAMEQILKANPDLGFIPLGEILNGDFKGAARSLVNYGLDLAETKLLAQLSGMPELQGIPLSELARGDWGGAINQLMRSPQAQKLLGKLPAGIKNLQVDKIMPIVNGVIAGDWKGVAQQALAFGIDKGINQLMQQFPQLANMPLGSFLGSGSIGMAELQSLTVAPIATLQGIGTQYLAQAIGSEIPINALPIGLITSLFTGGTFAKLDIPYANGTVETPVRNPVTGGTRNQVFTVAPCTERNCKHFELADASPSPLGSVNGRGWVEGASQSVPGGQGMLKVINGGMEPTGVVPWGTGAMTKLSLEEMNEGGNGKKGSAKVQLNFQFCFKTPFPIMGSTTHCSPHFIPVPTPWTVEEGGLMLVAAQGTVPDFIQNMRPNNPGGSPAPGQPGTANDPCLTTVASTGGTYPAPGGTLTGLAAENTQRYLARLSAGESSSNTNWGPRPGPGSNVAWGEYQFRGSTRAALMARYPNLDPWSSDKNVRDQATLAWIGIYGQERKINILGAIASGDFELADRVLGQNQFPSVPGGTQEVSMWRNPANVARYGPAGRTGSQSACPPRPTAPPNPNRGPDFLPGPGELYADGSAGAGGGNGPSGLSTGQFQRPASGPITSGFGPRPQPCPTCSAYHRGIDYGGRRGDPVRAADGGTVFEVVTGCREGNALCGGRLGNAVWIRHDNGMVSVYGHLQGVNIRTGQRVRPGEQIGTIGSTGSSTGPHLHFGLKDARGNYVDPARYIRR